MVQIQTKVFGIVLGMHILLHCLRNSIPAMIKFEIDYFDHTTNCEKY